MKNQARITSSCTWNATNTLGLEGGRFYYVFVILPFGLKGSPYVYHMVAAYVRKLEVPCLQYIDDCLNGQICQGVNVGGGDNFYQAQCAVFVACQVLIRLGYTLAINKCQLIPVQVIDLCKISVHGYVLWNIPVMQVLLIIHCVNYVSAIYILNGDWWQLLIQIAETNVCNLYCHAGHTCFVSKLEKGSFPSLPTTPVQYHLQAHHQGNGCCRPFLTNTSHQHPELSCQTRRDPSCKVRELHWQEQRRKTMVIPQNGAVNTGEMPLDCFVSLCP